MRLRISVKRHGLPETPIVWTVEKDATTISQLLEQVNEIIPLESGEWGLEDYAVELKGANGINFECLHFQPVGKVMKEDDEVIIRPLLTQDLKIRKISGRHQISSDGKHLVDGLAFGRPLLRIPADRPAIKIPPRKRRRITYDGEEEKDDLLALEDNEVPQGGTAEDGQDENGNRQLVLHADFEADDSDNNGDFEPREDDEDEDGSRQLVLHADFEDDDEEDDEDFEPDEDEDVDEDMDEGEEDEEVEILVKNDVKENKATTPNAAIVVNSVSSANDVEDDIIEPALADVSDKSTRAKIRNLHSAFPNSPLAVCKYVLVGSHGDEGEAYEAMTRGFMPTMAKSTITKASQAFIDTPTPSKITKAAANETEEEQNNMEIEHDEANDSLLAYYDRNGLPEGSIISGNALSHMAQAVKGSPNRNRAGTRSSNFAINAKNVKFALDQDFTNGLTSTPVIDHQSQEDNKVEESEEGSSDDTSSSGTSSDEENSSEGSNSGEDSAEDSSSEEDSSSDDSSQKVPEALSEEGNSDSSSESSSEEDSSSDDDSGPEETSTKPNNVAMKGLHSNDRPQAEPSSIKPIIQVAAPPGEGKKSTRLRNQRRRNTNQLKRYLEKGILPAGTTLSEYINLDVNEKTSLEDSTAKLKALRADEGTAHSKESNDATAAANADLEARRKALIDSLESGGIDVTSDLANASKKVVDSASSPATKTFQQLAAGGEIDQGQADKIYSAVPETYEPVSAEMTAQTELENHIMSDLPSQAATPVVDQSNPPNTDSPRRSRLDLGAGRRLLFGALGIKTPKSKQDEERVRSDLMKNVRPVLPPKALEELPSIPDEVVDEDPDAWREKITYRAVECCYDGVELSEPPFPFIQRWDPQQQYSWSQNGKRKKSSHEQSQTDQDNHRASKKRRNWKGRQSYAEEEQYLDASYEPSYQDSSIYMDSRALPTQESRSMSDDVEGEISQQLLNDLKADATADLSQSPEDLVLLPEDPAALPDLLDGEAKTGMTIAFKQLEMSEETGWQPTVSAYRTAVVISVLHNGELELMLALRDRNQSSKQYDYETGERIYGRFEMPDQDENDDEPEDDGMFNVMFTDLAEPKVVQGAPPSLSIEKTTKESEESSLPSNRTSNENSRSLGHEEEQTGGEFSHITETPLQSQSEEVQMPDVMVENLHSRSEESDLSVAKPIEQTSQVPEEVGTPKVGDFDADADFEPISDDARLKISRMIKDAGFRSSVPSSVVRGFRPTGMETPGDAAVFEKLLKDMTEIQNPLSSPRSNRLSPSPIKRLPPRLVSTQDRQPSQSPLRSEASVKDFGSEDEIACTPVNATGDSSWQTIETGERTSSPVKQASPQAIQQIEFSLPTSQDLLEEARGTWKEYQWKNSGPSPQSDKSGDTTLLESSNKLAGNLDITYPKLSLGSSFTSQISDHGRQPDVAFEESATTDTPKVAPLGDDSYVGEKGDSGEADRPELPFNSDMARQNSHGPSSDSESDLPPNKSANIKLSNLKTQRFQTTTSDDEASSDDFPSVEDVISQSQMKRETRITIPSKAPTNIDREYEKEMAALDAELSEDSQTTPKASQLMPTQFRKPNSQPSPSRISQARISQSQPARFTLPKGSQVMDLTLSSDLEPDEDEDEAEAEKVVVKGTNVGGKRTGFKTYLSDHESDDNYSERGWRLKRSSSLKGVRAGKQLEPRSSSETTANKTRRKATAR